MAHMEFDVAYGTNAVKETLADALAELTRGLTVLTEVVVEHGPAGGWPIVKFSGPVHHLAAVVTRYAGEDQADELAWLLGHIKED